MNGAFAASLVETSIYMGLLLILLVFGLLYMMLLRAMTAAYSGAAYLIVVLTVFLAVTFAGMSPLLLSLVLLPDLGDITDRRLVVR